MFSQKKEKTSLVFNWKKSAYLKALNRFGADNILKLILLFFRENKT